MKKYTTLLALSFSVFSILAFAHGGAMGIVKERMDLMDSLKGAMKVLKPIFRGQADYDVAAIKQNALVIRDNAAEHMTKLFPGGSLKKPSEAKPEIWDDWEEFERLANNLQSLGQALHDGAENQTGQGPGGMGGPGMMGTPGMGPGMMGTPGMGPGMMGDPSGGPGTRGHMRGMDNMTDEQLAAMPAQGLFQMVANNCTDCHKQFRIKKKQP